MTERGPRDSVTTLRDLPQAIEPGRDLWPQIESQIGRNGVRAVAAGGSRRGAAVPLRWLAAAAMVGCVAVGVWIGRSVLPGTVQVVRGPTTVVPVMPGAPTALDASYVSDPRYARQRAALLRSLQARLRRQRRELRLQ